jgi:hypothetical protein
VLLKLSRILLIHARRVRVGGIALCASASPEKNARGQPATTRWLQCLGPHIAPIMHSGFSSHNFAMTAAISTFA